MTDLSVSVALSTGTVDYTAAASTEELPTLTNLPEIPDRNIDIECANNCLRMYFDDECRFDDQTCLCTLASFQEKYFCCIAKECKTNVLPAAMDSAEKFCIDKKKPLDFDTEAVCGVKLPTSWTSYDTVGTKTEDVSESLISDSSITSSSDGSGNTAPGETSDTSEASATETLQDSGASRVERSVSKRAVWGVVVLFTVLAILN